MRLEEAIGELEEALEAWAARLADDARQERVREARAQLARVHHEAEQRGQLTLPDAPPEAVLMLSEAAPGEWC